MNLRRDLKASASSVWLTTIEESNMILLHTQQATGLISACRIAFGFAFNGLPSIEGLLSPMALCLGLIHQFRQIIPGISGQENITLITLVSSGDSHDEDSYQSVSYAFAFLFFDFSRLRFCFT